jgi:hypothetical protein
VIILIGPPGVGKSTFAINLQKIFLDTCDYHEKDSHLAEVRQEYSNSSGISLSEIKKMQHLYKIHVSKAAKRCNDAIRESICNPSKRIIILSSCNQDARTRQMALSTITDVNPHVRVVYVTIGKKIVVKKALIDSLPLDQETIMSDQNHPFHFYVKRIMERKPDSSSLDRNTAFDTIIGALKFFLTCDYGLSLHEQDHLNIVLGIDLTQDEAIQTFLNFLTEQGVL